MRISIALTAVLFLSFSVANAADFQQGTHYEVISNTPSSTKQVVEYYSLWSSACHHVQPTLMRLKTKLAQDVTYRSSHVDFMRTASGEIQQTASKALLAAEKLNKGDDFKKAVFESLHNRRKRITSLTDLKNIAQSLGINSTQFGQLVNSFGVNAQYNKNQAEQKQLKNKLNSVPTLIVNGKYKILPNSTKTPQEMEQLVTYLLNKK